MWELNWLGRLGSARSGAAGHPIGIVTGSSEDRLSLYDFIKGKGYRFDISSSGIAYKNAFELTQENAVSLDMGELFSRFPTIRRSKYLIIIGKKNMHPTMRLCSHSERPVSDLRSGRLASLKMASIISSVRKNQAGVFPSFKSPETDSLFPRCG
ncbi:MAG: hypothetical protein ACO2ZX_07580, partial [Paracoccaceae bacterium]